MYYIYENDKPNFFCKTFKIIKLQGNKIILPKIKSTEKQIEQLAKKTAKILNMANNKKIVLSKELQKQTTYINKLQEYPIDIIDGKWLYFMLLPEILEYILKKKDIHKEETTVHILVNDINENVIEFIKLLTKTYKTICIITKHIEKLSKIEEQIFEETGTIITAMNNKKKSLAKAKIIINLDFPEEFVNQYTICEDATIIDIQGNTRIKKKRFNGTLIVDYEICIKHAREYAIEEELFYPKHLYESEFYKKQPYKYVREKIKKDGIEIIGLYGRNSKVL